MLRTSREARKNCCWRLVLFALHNCCASCFGVYMGPILLTPGGFLNDSDIAAIAHGGAVSDSLKTRLFRAEGENRFDPIHRVVAEYLGAKWLARCFEDGVSREARYSCYFGRAKVCPRRCAGYNAWMAHFSVGACKPPASPPIPMPCFATGTRKPSLSASHGTC